MTSQALQIKVGWFDRTIDQTGFTHIRNTLDRNSVSNIWTRIADWLCGTNKEIAKHTLCDLLHKGGQAGR